MKRDSMWAGRLYQELGSLDDILTVGVTDRARNLYGELAREHDGKPDDSVRLPWNALLLAVEQQDAAGAGLAGTALLSALEAEFDLDRRPAPSGQPIPDDGTATEGVAVLKS